MTAVMAGIVSGLSAGYIPTHTEWDSIVAQWAEQVGHLAGTLIPLTTATKIAGIIFTGLRTAKGPIKIARAATGGGIFGGLRKPGEGETRLGNIPKDAAFFASLHVPGVLPISRVARTGLSTIPGAGFAAAAGASLPETLLAGAVTGGFGAIQPRVKRIDPGSRIIRPGDERIPTEIIKAREPGVPKEIIRPGPQKPTDPVVLFESGARPTEAVKALVDKFGKQLKEPTSKVGRVFDAVANAKRQFVQYVVDGEVRVRDLVSRKDVKVTDISDPYLRSTLYHGRVHDRVTRTRAELELWFREVNEAGISRNDVSEFLYTRHVPERNAQLYDGAAGIKTAEANARQQILIRKGTFPEIERLAEPIRQLSDRTLDILVEGQVIAPEFAAFLRERYPNHVPLNRIISDIENIEDSYLAKQHSEGASRDVRATGIIRATGGSRLVNDIVGNVAQNYEQAIIRAEKNMVDLSTLRFVTDNKDIFGDLFEVSRPKVIATKKDGTPITEVTNDPSILQMRLKGKPVWIKINDKNLAVALRGMHREQLGTFMHTIGTFTRLYSGLQTRFNPEFALPNKIRDLQEIMVYMAAQKNIGAKGVAKTIGRDPTSVVDVINELRGVDTPGARLYTELKDIGGTTGGMSLSTRKRVEISIDRLEALANSKSKRVLNNLVEYVDLWNTIFEDSSRLSVYKTALEKGYSKERAAFMAKESSINFNRFGRGGPVINAVWMFSNASIQGTAKMIRSFKDPKVLGATVATVGTAVAAASEWNDRVDPEWRDKVPKWDRLNGLVIVMPSLEEGEKFQYFTIPVSWGLKPIKVWAEYAYDLAQGRDIDTEDMINESLVAILEAYNPIGGTDLTSALSPTALDLIWELGRNKSWTGNKIWPDNSPNAPSDIKYFKSLKETPTGQAAISVTELLAGVTRTPEGERIIPDEKTGVAISPAGLVHAYKFLIGGSGRFVNKTMNALIGTTTGDPPPLDEWPMLSRFYRERTQEEVERGSQKVIARRKRGLSVQARKRFHIKDVAQELNEELQALPLQEAIKRMKDLQKSDPQAFQALRRVARKQARGTGYETALLRQFGVDNGARAKEIVTTIDEMETVEERKAYLQTLVDARILTDKVAEQIKFLKGRK